MSQQLTGAQAGLSGDEQIRITLRAIVDNGGVADPSKAYAAVERHMNGAQLSQQGKDSLRSLIYREAVGAGLMYPHDPDNPGWRVTAEGREFVESAAPPDEDAVNAETGEEIKIPVGSVRGTAFELYILELMRRIYPDYTWYHQGVHKSKERGLDLIGNLIGNVDDKPKSIGVQVKCHQPNAQPSETEWLKFLAGCFTRRIQKAVFVTTGSLSSEQRREAGEAEVLVMAGQVDINRTAKRYGLAEFDTSET